MAALDGFESLQNSSDEIYDNICRPCKTDGITKEAKHYCRDCSEYICDACKDYHRKLFVLKNHIILTGNKIPANVGKDSCLQFLCNCNTNKEVKHCCKDRVEGVCSPRKTFKNHKCNTFSIQGMSSGYMSSTFSSVFSKTKLSYRKKYDMKQSLSFEKNKKLTDLQPSIQTLGFLNTGYRRDKAIFNKSVLSKSQATIRSDDDEYIPTITGCSVMPNCYMVVCDWGNHKLKLLDSFGVLIEKLTLSCGPWDISVVDADNVIVALPNKMQLQYVQVFPKMKVGRIIQLDKKCWGLKVSGDNIYISCHNNPGDGEVRVLDLKGHIKRHLEVGKCGFFGLKKKIYMFDSPYYITVNETAEKVFVSDCSTHTITCMTVDGSIIYQYTDDDLKRPVGLFCDSDDNILVCGRDYRNVQVITLVGKKYGTLVTSSDGLEYPFSIAFRESDNTLVIGCSECQSMLFFKLTE